MGDEGDEGSRGDDGGKFNRLQANRYMLFCELGSPLNTSRDCQHTQTIPKELRTDRFAASIKANQHQPLMIRKSGSNNEAHLIYTGGLSSTLGAGGLADPRGGAAARPPAVPPAAAAAATAGAAAAAATA